MSLNESQDGVGVLAEIKRGNPWYLDSQFAWAENPSIKRIYDDRYNYFKACLNRARQAKGGSVRVLDAGCGDGYWLVRLGESPGICLTGIDYNPVRVERARKVAPKVSVRMGDLASLKSEEKFDVILFSQVLEHVPDDVALLRLLHDLLNKDGMLILGTPNEGSWLHQKHIRRMRGAGQTDHVHFYTEVDICSKIKQASFRVESVMREVFFIGNERLYYWLTARNIGYKFLKLMTAIWPRECSDYYFECRRIG